ncbi:HOL1 [Fusarium subglutinans]|uniref:HOL1 n=1 Tax=Gibberella subglutinans TaxID=42677 RepID=A0A8H5L448_GIBSU|nr:HOL1 [Fusarium subglutinans]KAF5585027.1 HOL1 [Fusarium subglutinans]
MAQSSNSVLQRKDGPMSWPLWWRLIMMGNLSFFVMMGQVLGASIPPMLLPLVKDMHVSSTKISQLTSWGTLCIGLGNIWALPTVAYIGSRYTILIGLAVFTAGFFWQARAQSYESLLAARVIGGLGGGVVEALGPVVVVLLFPREYVARAMSVYTWALGAGAVFGPLITGYAVDNLGSWRYPNYIFGGICALNLLVMILMFPEPLTNIRVPGDPERLDIAIESADEEQGDEPKKPLEEVGNAQQYETRPASVATFEPCKPGALWFRRSFFLTLRHNHPPPNFLYLVVEPFKILVSPAVVITVLLFGFSIAGTIATSILVSITFSQPPWLWTSGQVGLYNIAPLLGLMAGMPFGGAGADWLAERHLRRHGEFKPESVLPVLLPFAIATPVATTLIGVGFKRGWHWAVVGLFWAILNANLTGGCNVLISYCTESYPKKAIQIGVVVNVIKNVIGFGVSYSTLDWWMKDKYFMFLTIALVIFVLFIVAVPLWISGPKITRKTKTWVKYEEE